MSRSDTIAAIATPPGKGGIGVIRVSGPRAPAICRTLFGRILPARHAQLLPFCDAHGTVLDRGIALYFPAPHSYTGEHVLELQAHGGPVLLELLLDRVLKLDARMAQPGEFTERAFLNDKLDLTQAEAVIDLIESSTAQAARAAARSLEGAFSGTVTALQQHLTELRTYIEAALDFPDEEIDFLSDAELQQRMEQARAQIHRVLDTLRVGRLLKDGLSIVILGSPNAGKSSLLNALAGRDTAIVTEIAGTTRDVLREHIHIDGMPLHIIDTAGLRDSGDAIEQEGVRRAWKEVEQADRVLLIVDDGKGLTGSEDGIIRAMPDDTPLDIIFNKIDLSGHTPGIEQTDQVTHLLLSGNNGDGMQNLTDHLKQVAGYSQTPENTVIARQRHVAALENVKNQLDTAAQHLADKAGELAAEELRLAQQALSELTGEYGSEDLLGDIFSSFCIGK
jgi:tRNA modification GTPase